MFCSLYLLRLNKLLVIHVYYEFFFFQRFDVDISMYNAHNKGLCITACVKGRGNKCFANISGIFSHAFFKERLRYVFIAYFFISYLV